MHSALLFEAKAHILNRFLLARFVSKATRALHRPGTRIQDTTNDVLIRMSHIRAVTEALIVQPAAETRLHHSKAPTPISFTPKPIALTPTSELSQSGFQNLEALGA